jgi:uncharacterized protein YjgD (DUF1641 family)
MKLKKEEILEKFKPFLWSYDIDKIDLERNRKRIITNVLNLGTKEASDLLLEVYDKKDIIETIKNPLPGEWNDRSLNYWSIMFGVKPKKIKDVLRHIG